MDFIVGLPQTPQGFDAIYTFVDRLTKCVHLVPTTSKIDAKGSADLYLQNVFRLHGLSSTIVCDRDPRFASEFFRELFHQLGTTLSFSTANHPQTDGQTERMNRVIEDVLRAFVNHKQDNWDKLLPLCEFAINSSYQSSTSSTPFYLNYGSFFFKLLQYLNTNNFLPTSQFGYRHQHSTADALALAVENINEAQAAGQHTGVAFVDMSKAFDKVKHSILVEDLFELGLTSTALQWFSDYLMYRRQYVETGKTRSTTYDSQSGVPQGSVLGPFFFCSSFCM